jgi:HEPN domain-containing protein
MKHCTLDGYSMQTDRINELMEKATEELYAVDTLVDLSAAAWITGFHCQQIAEKTLKAVLISKGQIPAKTHDLVLLMNEVRESVSQSPDGSGN